MKTISNWKRVIESRNLYEEWIS